ncbi:MAG: P-II family nitrogen regulator [Spirochaetes bacterium]|nr:P-II family nitrogen regulator [Spirochaetota bacterium]
METKKYAEITCKVYKTIAHLVTDALQKAGITEVHIQTGRAVVLREKKGILGIGAGEVLDEDPAEVFRFHVPSEQADAVMNTVIAAAHLDSPGRGSIFVNDAEVIRSVHEPVQLSVPTERPVTLASGLMGICCIVQRGQGNTVIQSALDMGFSVPVATFGEGTGLRDKLGILRITIPAEKEVINMTVAEQDAREAMDTLVDAGKLDQPGKGFIYTYPVGRGLINTKIFRGTQKHAASVEQMISAIDDIKGSMEWRKRSGEGRSGAGGRKYLSNLVNFTLVCNEGRAHELVKAAMSVGAAGATISKLRYSRLNGTGDDSVSPAREMSDLIVGAAQVDAIRKAIEDADGFGKTSSAMITLKPVPSACTYLGGSR